jgi:hypothetical protein
MSMPASQRRLAENEVVFRSYNKSVQEGIDAVNQIAEEDGQAPISLRPDVPLFFYCECSNENCKQRIKILPGVYNAIHTRNDTFTIACGHEVKDVEDVTTVEKEYCIVKKHQQPPSSSASHLHVTNQ